MTERPLTFVVGTGRTGSTALSAILRAHPDVLSLSELFVGLDGPGALPADPVPGAEFWELLAGPHPGFAAMMRAGVSIPELNYPTATGRFTAETGIPRISLTVLPHLSGDTGDPGDPDALFDELAGQVRGWPERTGAGHLAALFDTLAERFGAAAIVERSGHSLSWVPALHRAFPRARFVHMFRDGPDCALSMSRHPGYRTAALANELLRHAGVGRISEITDEHVRRLPADLAELVTHGFERAFTLRREIEPARYGTIWSKMVTDGVTALRTLPAALRTNLGYEDLLADPAAELSRLAAFIGVDAPPAWLSGGAELLDASRTGGADALAQHQRAELRAECLPGSRALAAALAE